MSLSGGRLFRLICAVVLGFTSFAHGPVMATGAAVMTCHKAASQWSAQADHHTADIHHAAHESRHSYDDGRKHPPENSSTEKPGQDTICPMPGCFIMAAPPSAAAPVAPAPGGRVEFARVRATLAASPDPADPPPRLRA